MDAPEPVLRGKGVRVRSGFEPRNKLTRQLRSNRCLRMGVTNNMRVRSIRGRRMRIAPCLVTMLALAMGAHAAEPAKPASGTRPQPLTRSHQWTAAELEILDQLEARAFANYPRRRDDPLRE